jgi:hypothetical protein
MITLAAACVPADRFCAKPKAAGRAGVVLRNSRG